MSLDEAKKNEHNHPTQTRVCDMSTTHACSMLLVCTWRVLQVWRVSQSSHHHSAPLNIQANKRLAMSHGGLPED
jgi:hypothetical protein